MLNTTAWNWGCVHYYYIYSLSKFYSFVDSAKAGFFWAGSTALCLIWAFFRLPETKGLTYAELDLLFEKRVSARDFKKARGQPYTGFGAISLGPEEKAPQSSVEKI